MRQFGCAFDKSWRRFAVLASKTPTAEELLQDYDKLRASLTEDNLAARLYAKWLTAFLDWIERFFGDAGMANRVLDMEEVQSLTEDLRLMIHFDPKPLTGVQTAEALLQLLLDIVWSRSLSVAPNRCFALGFQHLYRFHSGLN